MNPKISVIIPNYNYSGYLKEAIDSVLAQTYENIEIIIVDDGSTDNSREVIESYGDKVIAVFQQNQGVAAARNNGFAHSSGEYVAFLDADDVWIPEKIAWQVEKFAQDPSLGQVHVAINEIDADGNFIRSRAANGEGDISIDFLLSEQEVFYGGGSGGMILSRAFKEAGGFDEKLTTSADWDLYFRVANLYPVGQISKPLLKYRIHGKNMHGNVPRKEREMMYIFEKAFSKGSLTRIRNAAYANLSLNLAFEYLDTRDYKNSLRQMGKSIRHKPSNFGHFAAFPFGYMKRKLRIILT